MTAVDVVVVAYRSEGSIESCLRAASAIPGFGVAVVVDHGDDRSGALARSAGAQVVIDPSNPGFGAGQNRGVQLTSAPYVLLLNPDAVVVGEAVARGAALLDAEPDVAAMQGVIRNARDGQIERSQGVELRPVHLWGRAFGAKRLRSTRLGRAMGRRIPALSDHVEREPATAVDVEYLAATALLVRRAAFDEVGGLDEGYFLYGEDIDLSRRLRESGWRLVAIPGAWAEHDNGASSSTSMTRELEWWRGTMRYTARWWSTPAWVAGVAAASMRAARIAASREVGPGAAFGALVRDPVRARRTLRIR